MLMMNPGRLFAGFAALVAPAAVMLFALAAVVSTSWRAWLGKPPPRKKPDDEKK